VHLAARFLLAIIVLGMLGAGLFAPYPYDRQDREEIAAAPSRAHLLGTDAVGRDRLSRLLYGGRVSLLLAPAAAIVSVGIALAVALAAAFWGGRGQRAATMTIDLVLSLPWLFLLLAVRAVLPLNASPGASVAAIFGLLALLGWAAPARVLMAAAAHQLRSGHVLMARASGCSGVRLALVHVAPNLTPIAAAQFWVTAPVFILSESNLALLGLGISEPLPSWGNLLRDLENLSVLPTQPWVAVPLVLLIATLVCCQLARPADEYSL
jgi:peptide/nickel transport system permease protein